MKTYRLSYEGMAEGYNESITALLNQLEDVDVCEDDEDRQEITFRVWTKEADDVITFLWTCDVMVDLDEI